jgi:hypothetical protein
VGEITVDTTKDTAVVHDGSVAGGFPLLRQDLNNLPNSSITADKLAFTLSSEALSKDFTVSSTGSVSAQRVVSLTGSTIGDNPVVNPLTSLVSTATNLTYSTYDNLGLLLVRPEYSGGTRYRQAPRQSDGSFLWAADATQVATYNPSLGSESSVNTTTTHLAGAFYFVGMAYYKGTLSGAADARGNIIEVNPTTGALVATSNAISVVSDGGTSIGSYAAVGGIKTDIPNRFVLQEYRANFYVGGGTNSSKLATITSSGAISTVNNGGTSEGWNVTELGWFLLTNNKVLGVRNGSSFGIADYNGSSFQNFSTLSVDTTYSEGTFAWYRPTTANNLFVGAFKTTANTLILRVYEYNTSTLAMEVRDTKVISTGAATGAIGSITGSGYNIVLGWENNDVGYVSTFVINSTSKTITAEGILSVHNTVNKAPVVSGPNTGTNVYSAFYNNAVSGVDSRRVTVAAYGTNPLIPIGIAKEAGASNATVDVAIAGVVGGFTGLTAGTQYYYDTSLYNGSLTTTVTTIYVGRAISSTEILLAL